MSAIRVHCGTRRLTFGEIAMDCAIGRNGCCEATIKREGDGCTPIGVWPIRGALLRPGKAIAPPKRLPWRWIRPQDGWSDDPFDPAYNRPVRLPRLFSAESLMRADGAYDVILVLGHNDDPPIPGAGSAIFLHLSEGRPTAGCVAIEREDMAHLLRALMTGDVVEIVA